MGMRFSLHGQFPGQEYQTELLSTGVKFRAYADVYLMPHMEPVDEYGYTQVKNLPGFHAALEERISYFEKLMHDQDEDFGGYYNERAYYLILRDLSSVALCLEANGIKWSISVC